MAQEARTKQKTSKQAEKKKQAIKKIVELTNKYPIIGVINMHALPAAQLARMRHRLRKTCEIFMTRKRLIKLALEKVKKPGIEQLEPYLKGMPALLFTDENPFALYKTIKKAKTKAPARQGQEAPFDIIIPAGPTPFAPGPIISELASMGIQAGVEAGKVAVKKDALVCKEGEKISADLAGLLTRLGIEPVEIGLDLVAVYEKGIIYPKKVLDIDEEKFLQDLIRAATWAFSLSVEAGIPTPDTAELMIQKAYREAKSIAKEGNVLTSETAEEIIEQAERETLALKAALPEEALKPAKERPAEKKEEPKPVEQPKPEKKPDFAMPEKKKEPEKTKPEESGKKKAEPVDSSLKQITDDKAHEQAENLANELIKKGTLRKQS